MEGLGRRTFDNEENGKNRKKKRARAHTSSVNDELDNLKEHWGRSFYRLSSTFNNFLPSFSLSFLSNRLLILVFSFFVVHLSIDCNLSSIFLALLSTVNSSRRQRPGNVLYILSTLCSMKQVAAPRTHLVAVCVCRVSFRVYPRGPCLPHHLPISCLDCCVRCGT